MNEAIYTENYKGLTINIYHDTMPDNPRNWDNFGHMTCWHPRYSLGDEHSYTVEEFGVEILARTDILYLPLYLYDHSGITISSGKFASAWDSGQVGYTWISYDEIAQEYGNLSPETMERAKKLLEAEVKTYDDFLTGRAYGYAVLDANGEVLNSCWGFYESDDADPYNGSGCVVEAAREGAEMVANGSGQEISLELSFTCPVCAQRNLIDNDKDPRLVMCDNCNNQFPVRV